MKGPYDVRVQDLQGIVLWHGEKLTDSYVTLPLDNLRALYLVTVFDKEHRGRLKLVKQ